MGKHAAGMIGIERLDKCLQIIGATSAVQNGMGPISAALIAPSDAGKSRLMLNNLPRDVRIVNDLTTMTLQNIISEKEPPSYLAIPDFNTVISHKPTVAELTMAMLLSLMAEGVTELNPGMQKHIVSTRKGKESKGIRIAIVTGMTPEMFHSKRGKWRATGFLRRLVPINYAYSRGTRERIQLDIAAGRDTLDYAHRPAVPRLRRSTVEIPRAMNHALRLLSETVVDQLLWKQSRTNGSAHMVKAQEYPFSMHKTLRQLARASAVLDQRLMVADSDLAAVQDMSKFMRYDRPEEI